MEERRREKRTVEFLEIKEINHRSGEGSQVLDISPLGAKLETPFTFSPGEAVEFTYLRPGEEQEHRRWGQAIWVLPAPNKPGRYLVGLELFQHAD